MIDLTKIEKPFGLLDEETKDALRKHEGDFEVYNEAEWHTIHVVFFQADKVYRAKAGPKVFWIIEAERYSFVACNEKSAIRFMKSHPEYTLRKVVEVDSE